jgi:DNA-directed RNA polymerase subunit E'/Rpb7
MFALAVVTDSIRIHPKSSQSCSLLQSVTASLDARFCNRVLSGVGLVLKVFDVLELEEPIIHAGESHSTVKGTSFVCSIG